MVHQLDKMADYPAVKFTTAKDFFKKSAVEAKDKPTHHGEMQFIFEGCYTTVSEIKSGNRNNENMLYSNEFFNTLRWLKGDNYPAEEIRDLWITQTFNQFHDILPGSAITKPTKSRCPYMKISGIDGTGGQRFPENSRENKISD